MNRMTAFFKNCDWPLLYTLLALNIIGLLNTFSATLRLPSQTVSPLFYKQLIYMILGWIILFIFNSIRIELWLKWAYAIYALAVGLLVLTLVFGRIGLGAKRWLDLGFFNLQPSEFAKLAVVLVLIRYLLVDTRAWKPLSWSNLRLPLVLILTPSILTIKQPDLGSGGLIALIGFSLLAFYGIKTRVILVSAAVGLLALPLAWRFGLKDYQKKRIEVFIAPESDPRGSGYNSIQSKIAIGSGRFFGKGYLQGTQSKFEFLPESHTDFTFAVLCEEHGFVGAMGVITLFMILLTTLLQHMKQASETTHLFLIVATFFYFFWHFSINIGMVTGLLPIVGIPLPFFSYGGSHILMSFVFMGLTLQAIRRRFMF